MFERYEGWNDLVAGLYLFLEEIKDEKKKDNPDDIKDKDLAMIRGDNG